MEYYQQNISEIFKEFQTSKNGLAEGEALLRLRKYGFNKLSKVKKTPLIFKFLNQFTDLLAIVLMVGGILSFLIGAARDGLIIFGIVLLNAIIGFIQEYKAEKILAAFKKHIPTFVKVVRQGQLKQILSFQVVPGDILSLEAGDAVPADARLIEAYNLKTNDFALTGESQPQIKKAYQISKVKSLTDIDNMVFMGTAVAEGKGKAIVVETGMNTAFGKVAYESQQVREEPTPLQKELTHTGKVTVKIALAIVVITLILFYLLGRDMKESLILAIAVAVAVVPEGLPAATSVALSLGAQRMLKKRALVKKLLHVESLGSVTTICTDKTGTLTSGEMSVVKVQTKNLPAFLDGLILCNNAQLDDKSIGDPLEIALLKYAQRQKVNLEQINKANRRVFEIPFSSKRKMMTVVCQQNKSYYSFTKGACLEILSRCKISPKEKEKIVFENDQMAEGGLRVLALAGKNLPNKNYNPATLEQDLNFLGLVGFEDPPREGVSQAIKLCQKAQIKVIMITGDYGLTAKAIAGQIGLASDKTQVISGEDLHHMDDEALKKILQREIIFARTSPSQKLRIVKNLQEMGEVVAVTGDGVNDAPALVKADIGVAMGKIGTDVAKETADMILLDDHFATIVSAVREGRRIFDNAKKFVFYVFSSNGGELFVTLFGILAGLPLPLLAVQILAIDLGTDVFPSLALGVEQEEPKIMEKPPVSKTERILSSKMLSRLLFIGVTMAILALFIYLFSLYQGGWRYGSFLAANSLLYFQATAAAYATLVFCQIANAFSCRSDRLSLINLGFLSNRWLLLAELLSLTLLWGIMDFPPLQNLFRTSSPLPLAWLFIFLSFFIFLFLAEWFKKKAQSKSAR